MASRPSFMQKLAAYFKINNRDFSLRMRDPSLPPYFSDTSCLKLVKSKGSIGHAFTVCIRTENQNQVSFCPFALREVSVLAELTLGHLRYLLTDVPPQSNSPPDTVFRADRGRRRETSAAWHQKTGICIPTPALLNK